MNTEYHYERLSEKNISDLLPLYLDAFNEVRTLESVLSKFDTEVFGAKNLAFIAYDQNNIAAAFYALFPVTVLYQQQKIIAAQVGDLMTHSNHRRRGLFLELATRTHELAWNEGVQLIFTIPYGENSSFKGFVTHLNFKKTYSLQEYEIKSNTLPLAALSEKNPLLKFCYTKYAQLLLTTYKSLYEFSEHATGASNTAEVLKDKQFFSYKKFSTTWLLKLGETEVWFKIKKGTLMVGDIRNLSPENVAEFIVALKRLCFKLGIRVAQIDVAPDSKQDIAFRSAMSPIAFYYHVLVLISSTDSFEEVKFCLGDLDSF